MEKNNEENLFKRKKALKNLFTLSVFLMMILLLVFYWLFPSNLISFTDYSYQNNFSTTTSLEQMQFFKNMRYLNSNISYKISNCTIQKKQDMLRAFDILENLTVLNFYPVNKSEDISVFCQEKGKLNNVLFIAGEGGPTNVTYLNNFVLINHGKVLLIKESHCSRPNIALHELLHALGFKHSKNPNNLMFNITRCEQSIGKQIPQLINKLYSIPNEPDLSFFNISAEVKYGILKTNFVLRNSGFKKSKKARIDIYVNNNIVGTYNLGELEIGEGVSVSINKIKIPIKDEDITNFKYYIIYPFNELDKDNNLIILNTTTAHISYTSF